MSAVVTDELLRARVENALLESAALERFWGRSLTHHQIQAEMDRMAQTSRDPVRLAELFSALKDDPLLVAEVLVRPILADRLLRSWYARDRKIHGPLRDMAESARAGVREIADLRGPGGEYFERVLRLVPPPQEGGSDMAPLIPAEGGPPEMEVDAVQWKKERGRLEALGLNPGGITDVQEDDASFYVTAWISEEPAELRTATVRWRKVPFDRWWGDEKTGLALDTRLAQDDPSALATQDPDSQNYRMPALAAIPCTDDTWSPPMEWTAPSPRKLGLAVWTGSEMIVWGGENNGASGVPYPLDGGRYDPATDSWTPTSTGPVVPCGRNGATAVWTGSEMIVWGGLIDISSIPTNTGGRYNPATDTWLPTSTGANTPTARDFHTAIWTGAEMIVWGGGGPNNIENDGGRYDPLTDSWLPTSLGPNLPVPRALHTAVWSNGRMLIWGGLGAGNLPLNSGAGYNPSNDTWLPITTTGAPAARSSHSAVWTNGEMIVWGGRNAGGGNLQTGGRYKPSTNSWQPTSTGANVPQARELHLAVWTGSEMIVWGGTSDTGARYLPSTDTWTPMAANTGFFGAMGVWTGTELIFWADSFTSQLGGRYDLASDTWIPIGIGGAARFVTVSERASWTGSELLVYGNGSATGTGYDPATNTWSYMGTAGSPPAGRVLQTQVWTGHELVVWGGFSGFTGQWEVTGGRYDPATGSWTPTSTAPGVPTARYAPSVVWSGREMIVWGGEDIALQEDTNTGARYDPARDQWTPMGTGPGVPQARENTPAAWTSSEMIVWGGYSSLTSGRLNTGGRYDPATDTWTPTSTGANNPAARSLHSLFWTGDRMIVWGGNNDSSITLDSGGLYDSATDSWVSTAIGPATPIPRRKHAAAWTGRELVVWGGEGVPGGVPGGIYRADGGRYDPITDTWTPTSTGQGVLSARSELLFAWTGNQMMVRGGTYIDISCAVQNYTTGALYCAGPCETPAGVNGLTARPDGTDGTLLAWPAVAGATSYDIVRGSLSALRATAGDYSVATLACVATATPAPSALDEASPSAGDGLWYLVRARACGAGTYDSTSVSQSGLRDGEIAASGLDCQ